MCMGMHEHHSMPVEIREHIIEISSLFPLCWSLVSGGKDLSPLNHLASPHVPLQL